MIQHADAPYWPLQAREQYVVAQLGQSLDGRIATSNGHSQYVTGEADRRHLHRLRAYADAVVVGASTILADDPQLTVRAVEGEHPARVILDPSGRVPPDRKVFTDGAAPTFLCIGEGVGGSLQPVQGRLLRLPTNSSGFDPVDVVSLLASLGLRRLLIEGGGRLVSSFLARGAIDHLYLTIAPVIIGSGIQGLNLPAIQRMDEALRPRATRYHLDADTLYRLDFDHSGAAG